MSNMATRLSLTLCLFLCSAIFAYAQDERIEQIEAEVATLQLRIGEAPTDEERLRASEQMKEVLISSFEMEEMFNRTFPTWNKLGTLISPDNAFRLFNWNIPMKDGSYKYCALILFPDKKYRQLNGGKSLTANDERRVFTADDWYGALYYHIMPVKHRGDTFYTLMGWDGHNALSNKKMLDAMWFDKKNEPRFGKAVFNHGGKDNRMRRVFEYTKSGNMTLAYLPEKEVLVYNVLIPKPGATEGNYSMYMAGTEYDGYRLKGGEWQHEEGVDMSRPKSEENKAQFNFPARPDLNRTRSTKNPITGE